MAEIVLANCRHCGKRIRQIDHGWIDEDGFYACVKGVLAQRYTDTCDHSLADDVYALHCAEVDCGNCRSHCPKHRDLNRDESAVCTRLKGNAVVSIPPVMHAPMPAGLEGAAHEVADA